MNLPTRFLADLAERALRTFIQAYLAAVGVGAGGVPDFDELFTADALKVALAATFVAVLMGVLARPLGNPDSPSALPPSAQPPAPRPVDPTLAPEDAPVVPQALSVDDQIARILGLEEKGVANAADVVDQIADRLIARLDSAPVPPRPPRNIPPLQPVAHPPAGLFSSPPTLHPLVGLVGGRDPSSEGNR